MPRADISGPDPLTSIAALLPPVFVVRPEAIDAAPHGKGAYVLLLHFAAPLRFLHKRMPHRLEAGWYAYSGSAYGPGGMRARLRRHFRRDKKLHWHVDHLTVAAEQIRAAALANGSECGIVARLTGSGAFHPALEGFGASDCRCCPSHLLEWRG